MSACWAPRPAWHRASVPAAPCPAPSGLGQYVFAGLRLQAPRNKSKARGARALKNVDQPNMAGGSQNPAGACLGSGTGEGGRRNLNVSSSCPNLLGRRCGPALGTDQSLQLPRGCCRPSALMACGQRRDGWARFYLKWTRLARAPPSHCCLST